MTNFNSNFTKLGLARGKPGGCGLDAVSDGVTQHVFKRRGNALKHAAVQFNLTALNVEVGALACFLGRLTHDAIEALR